MKIYLVLPEYDVVLCDWFSCIVLSGYWPVSDDFRHVGREDHLLVRWTQRNEKVSIIIIHDVSCNRLNPTVLSFTVVHTETLEAGLLRNPDLVELTNELAFSDYRWQVVQITGENTPVCITVHAFFKKVTLQGWKKPVSHFTFLR